MHSYHFLSHTADISIEVEADSMEELFLAGLLGMNEVLCENFCRQAAPPSIEHAVAVRSVDSTTLLIDFLSAVLTHTYLERALFCRLDVHELTGNFIRATIHGSPLDQFEDDIKAVTYHGADVVHDGKWRTPIIFDI